MCIKDAAAPNGVVVMDELGEINEQNDIDIIPGATAGSVPGNIHRFTHNKSILALAVTKDHIYAGTQAGDILVFALRTYELESKVEAHNGSVLALGLSQDEALLFSSAGDRFVNVWDTASLKHLASIYSIYDIGDIFCLAYSPRLETIYLGSQNTSIQWYNLKDYTSRPPPDPDSHPSMRRDRFFDSSGPGGVCTPRRLPGNGRDYRSRDGRNLEINKNHVHQFAHFGYVYCMLLAKGQQAHLPKEEVLISGGGDGVIKLWSLVEDGDGGIIELTQLEDGRDVGESVLAIVLDGLFLYSGRVEGEVNVWDLETRQLLRTVKIHDYDILTLSIGHGILFAAAVDGSVTKIDQRYETIGSWQAHEGIVLSSAFTTYNNRPIYVTGGNDDTVGLWDVGDCLALPTVTRTSHEHLVDALRQFISFRTVSSDMTCKADCRRAASWLRSVLKKLGASTELIKTDDGYNPIVFGRFRGTAETSSERKKILFYGHYDVVRAEKKENDHSSQDPFVMAGIDGYLYGRGTSDNKGPVMAAIYAAADLFAQNALGSDIVFIIEGEEECGSRGFKQAIQRSKHLIGDIDWILLANSYWLDDEVPCLTYGLRGVMHATVEISSERPDLHSGLSGSSLLDEALKDLVALLSRLTGRHGKVKIPGFYDAVLPLSEHERSLYSDIARTLLEGDPSLGSEESITTSLITRWVDPTLTIHNFKTSGPSNTTIIPRSAEAALSLRLVPNQDVDEVAKALVDFLAAEFAELESRNRLEVRIGHKAEPWLGDYNNALFQTLEQAIMDVWSAPPRPRRHGSVDAATMSMTPANGLTSSATNPDSSTSSSLPNGSGSSSSAAAIEAALFSSLLPTTTSSSSPPSSTTTTNNDNHKPHHNPTATPQRKPLYIREGGSIPAIRFLEKEFAAKAAHLPCGQASDNAHLDGERFRVLNLWNSREIFGRVLRGVVRGDWRGQWGFGGRKGVFVDLRVGARKSFKSLFDIYIYIYFHLPFPSTLPLSPSLPNQPKSFP